MSESSQSPVHMHEHESYRNMQEVFNETKSADSRCGGGCPGSKAIDFKIDMEKVNQGAVSEVIAGAASAPAPSELRQWPVQLRLLPVRAPFFQGADLTLVADCVPFANPNFHADVLKGTAVAVGCPKLDDAQVYVEKVTQILGANDIRSLKVVYMEVPCCRGLVWIAEQALARSGKQIPYESEMVRIGL